MKKEIYKVLKAINRCNIRHYSECATRLEGRGNTPPTKAYVDNLINIIKATGIEAIWHSAVSQECRALFPSKVFPNVHPKANYKAFHYLIDKVHSLGRPIISWYALNHNAGLIEQHPNWAIIPMQGGDIHEFNVKKGEKYYFCCINSPYGEILPEFCREVIRDVGFDGMWFDGSTWAVQSNNIPGCLCNFCQKKFRKDTGLKLPDKPDFDSDIFKTWIRWRYECLMDVWKRCVDAILSERSDTVVCFNNYRRYRDVGWHTAIPLRRLGWQIIMAGELDLQWAHGDFQMKMHRAYECKYLPESWMALCDYWMLWAPDIDAEPPVQAALSCIGGGGFMSMGTDKSHFITDALKKIENTSSQLVPYVGGETVEYAAILVSQNTQDFYYRYKPLDAWKSWHGANDLCNCAHLQSSVIFDDHVSAGELAKYPVILGGNFACVSDAQAKNLKKYVSNGGILFLCADAGTRDETGNIRKRGIFDDLLNITERKNGKGFATLIVANSSIKKICGKYLSFQVKHNVYKVGKIANLIASLKTWDMGNLPDKIKDGDGAGVWFVKYGRGYVVFSAIDIFTWHYETGGRRYVDFFKSLMTFFVKPQIYLEAPLHVVANTRRKNDEMWFIILHNAPGNMLRYNINCSGVGTIFPVTNIVIRCKDKSVACAVSGLSGKNFEIVEKGKAVRVPVLDRVEVIELRFMNKKQAYE